MQWLKRVVNIGTTWIQACLITLEGISERSAPLATFILLINFSTALLFTWKYFNLSVNLSILRWLFCFKEVNVLSIKKSHCLWELSDVEERLVKKALKTLPISSSD